MGATIDNSECIREETPRCYFQSTDDVQRHIREMIKNWNDAIAAEKRGVVESYIQGKFYIAGRVLIRPHDFEFDVVFRVLPSRDLPGSAETGNLYGCALEASEDRSEQGVFVPIAHFIDSPEGRVSSLVSLECHKKRPYFFGDRCAPLDCIREGGSVLAEWKRASPELRFSTFQIGDGPNSVVKCGANIGNSIPDEKREIIQREWFRQADFVNLVSRLYVVLGNDFLHMVFPKSDDLGIQLLNVMPCSVDL